MPFERTLILAMVVALTGAAVWEIRSTLRSKERDRDEASTRRAGRFLLAALGILVPVIASPLSDSVVLPVLHATLGRPTISCVTPPAEIAQQAVAFLASAFAACYAIGRVAGRRRTVLARDGYWLSNPFTIILGFVVYATVAKYVPAYESSLQYWESTMWLMLAIIATPLYARAFRAGARARGAGFSSPARAPR